MASNKHLLFSVTIEDCEIQTFRSGGKGGQNQNSRDSGVRIVHRASGARGESREHREQIANKRAAFLRMAATPEFQSWHRAEVLRRLGLLAAVDRLVEEQMGEQNLRIEVMAGGKWVVEG